VSSEPGAGQYRWLELEEAIRSNKIIFALAHAPAENRLLEAMGIPKEKWRRKNIVPKSSIHSSENVKTAQKGVASFVLFDETPAGESDVRNSISRVMYLFSDLNVGFRDENIDRIWSRIFENDEPS
jgi:hypothetical protein